MLTYGKWATVRDDHISGAMPLCRWVTMRARSGYTSQIAVSDPRRRLLNGRAVTARNGAGEGGASPLTDNRAMRIRLKLALAETTSLRVSDPALNGRVR